LPNGGEIALTWARSYTPNGTALAARGVQPDVCTAAGAGDGPDAPVAQVIDRALGAKAAPRDVEAARSACPAETQAGEAEQLEVARHLLADHALLARLTPKPGSQLATKP
jgi:hypothetical protein